GEFLSLRVENEAVMGIGRSREPEQRLEQPLDMGRREEIVPARHQRYALVRIIDHDGQVITRRQVLAGGGDIAEKLGTRNLGTGFSVRTFPRFLEAELIDKGARLGDVEAQRVGFALPDATLAEARRQPAA